MLDETASPFVSSGPAQGAAPGESPQSSGKLRVFISYSRSDLTFADQLYAGLAACGFDPSLDRHDISGGEEWRGRLTAMISEADTIIFVLSPVSASSQVCAWEVDEAARFGKRILPVVCAPLSETEPPSRLREMNYIFFYPEPKAPGSGFGFGLMQLVEALNTDYGWLRAHTHYLQHAIDWESGGRPASRLLSGSDITEAKTWMGSRPLTAPQVTDLHREFIRASEEEASARAGAERQRLDAMAAAQTEREVALRKAEAALKEAEQARRRKARVQSIALAVVSSLLVATAFFGWRAETNRRMAWSVLDAATDVFLNVRQRLSDDELAQVAGVYRKGEAIGHARSINNLGVAYIQKLGVARDLNEARRLLTLATRKGDARAMANLGRMYQLGRGGLKPDLKKARELYEQSATAGDSMGMFHLGRLHHLPDGPDYDLQKARAWLERSAALGQREAGIELDLLRSKRLQEAGDLSGAIRALDELLAGLDKPGSLITDYAKVALNELSWVALLARDPAKALGTTERIGDLYFDQGAPLRIRGHALLFLGRVEEAKALYLADDTARIADWPLRVAQDFAELKKAGLDHPMMDEIEKALAANAKGGSAQGPSSGQALVPIEAEQASPPSGAEGSMQQPSP